MLKLHYLFPNYDLAKQALTHWEHNKTGLDELLSKFRISSNAIYPFAYGWDKRILRLSPVSEKCKESLLAELEFIQYAASHNCPAAQPIPSKEGELLVTIDTPDGGWYASVFEFAKGVRLDRVEAHSEELMFGYGAALARLHVASAAYTPTHTQKSYADALKAVMEDIKDFGVPGAYDEANAVLSELGKFEKNIDNYGLVHFDFELDNVFYDEESDKYTAIDFEDCIYSWYYMDIICALEEIYDSYDVSVSMEYCKAFRLGYDSIKPMDTDSRDIDLLRRFLKIFYYGRLLNALDFNVVDNPPDWLINLEYKLKSKAKIVGDNLFNG